MSDQDNRLSELYHRSASSQSPAELDQTILETAERLAPEYKRRAPVWLPLASAASVIGLATLLYYQTGTLPTAGDSAVISAERAKEYQHEPRSMEQSAERLMNTDSADPAEESVMAFERSEADIRKRAKEITIEAQASPATDVTANAAQLPAMPAAVAASLAREAEVASKAEAMPSPSSLSSQSLRRTGAAVRGVSALAEDEAVSPEQWLENINSMLTDGDAERAVTQFRYFKNTYPDYPVPEDVAETIAQAELELRTKKSNK